MDGIKSYKSNKKRYTKHEISVICIFFLISVIFVFPLLLVISVSFSKDSDIMTYGYSLIPKEADLGAYKLLFKDLSSLVHSYLVTIIVSVAGAGFSVLIMSMLAYAMSRHDFKYSRHISFYVFSCMLFSGGMVPLYILVVNYLHLKDTMFALILPYIVVPWNVMLMKGFLLDIPHSIIESAKIDGASEFKIFFGIILPLSKAGLATVGLFMLLQYWNDYYLSMLFIERSNNVSLQYLLYRIMSNVDFLRQTVYGNLATSGVEFPSLSSRMAMCVMAAGPMLFIFPFFQKYFVKGISVGAVKG